MNWNEIKKLPFSCYEVSVDAYDIEATLERYLGKHNLNLSPWFQRGHVWTEEQQVAYIEHLLSGSNSATMIQFNKPGWMGRYRINGEMTIVDGLQRLTAVRKFVADELEVYGQKCSEFGDLCRCPITLKFNICNVETEKELVEWYLKLNSGGTIHTKEELGRVRSGLNDKYS